MMGGIFHFNLGQHCLPLSQKQDANIIWLTRLNNGSNVVQKYATGITLFLINYHFGREARKPIFGYATM